VLPVGVERSRAPGCPEIQQPLEGLPGDAQRLAQLVAGRLGERDVDPEEAPAFSQPADPFPLGGSNPFDYLCHRFPP
jgi:hypothetical protein